MIKIKYSKKKILVIGGAGYIGRKFCQLFCNKYSIDVIDNFWFSKKKIPNVNTFNGDIHKFNYDNLIKKNYHSVLILSGLSNDPMANLSPDLNFKNNNYAISNLLFSLSKSKIRKIIFGSSCSVYGNTKGKIATEKTDIKVEYPYGISKYLMDMFIEVLNKSNNSPSFYSLRQGTVCGFGPRMRFDLVVNKMIKDAILYKKIHTIDKNIWRPILDISDACAVYDKIINNKVPKGIYNVYSYNITVDQIAKKIQKFLYSKGLFVKIVKNFKVKEKRNYKVSRKKIEKYIKFEFKTIDDTITDIYNNIINLNDLESEKYLNIYHFKKKFKI